MSPIFLHLCQYLLFFFFILAILVVVQCYLIVVLIFISLTLNDAVQLFMCLGNSFISFGEMSLQTLCPFLSWIIYLCFYYWVMSPLYSLDINPLSDIWPILQLSFHFLMASFWNTKVFTFDEFIYFFSFVTCACAYLRNHCLIQGNENLFLYLLRVL